jgi:hypothetical protein
MWPARIVVPLADASHAANSSLEVVDAEAR